MVASRRDEQFDPKRSRERHCEDLELIAARLRRRSDPIAADLFSGQAQSLSAIHAYNSHSTDRAEALLRSDLERIEMYNQEAADISTVFLSSRPHDNPRAPKLTVVGSFATVVALDGFRPTNRRGEVASIASRVVKKALTPTFQRAPRFHTDLLEYTASNVGVTEVDGSPACLRELGWGDYLPPTLPLGNILQSRHFKTSQSKLMHASGTRIVTCRSIDGNVRLTGHCRCQLLTAVRKNWSKHDVAMLNRLVAPSTLVDASSSYLTHRCVGAHYVFHSGNTETRFVYFHRETGHILALGMLSAWGSCPYQHPGEYVDAVHFLARSA